MLAAGRLMLGLAQGGIFPGAAKAVAEWFPARERATAMGMVNGGSSVGAVACPACRRLGVVLRPVALGLLSERRDRAALDRLVAVGLLPAGRAPATLRGRTPRDPRGAGLRPRARRRAFPGGGCWSVPEVWGMVLGKACCDAVWFTYIAWLPKYFVDMRGFDNAQIGSIAWIPYAASGIGSVAGGWCSGRLLRSGYSLNFSRKVVLGACAAVMPCMCLVTHVPVHMEIALFSIAFFAHLSFSTLVITLPADMFPRAMVGSVVGLVGFGGSMGGMLFNKFAGSLLARHRPRSGLSPAVRGRQHVSRRGISLDPLDHPQHSTDRTVRGKPLRGACRRGWSS